jgi:hypothetical protein
VQFHIVSLSAQLSVPFDSTVTTGQILCKYPTEKLKYISLQFTSNIWTLLSGKKLSRHAGGLIRETEFSSQKCWLWGIGKSLTAQNGLRPGLNVLALADFVAVQEIAAVAPLLLWF